MVSLEVGLRDKTLAKLCEIRPRTIMRAHLIRAKVVLDRIPDERRSSAAQSAGRGG